MLTVNKLSKYYGSYCAVNQINLDIKNELFIFLGPNGAGKTTTIKMMTGLIAPTSGSILINGIDLIKDPLKAKQSFGLVQEECHLYEKLKGREFVEFIAAIYKVPPQTAQKRMSNLFDIFEMNDRADDFIEDYSHGMKQKIALTSALIHDPDVLFLDEPTVGLDPKAVRNLKDLLKGLVKKGKTVFMSTHILEIAESMADRVGIINNGELAAIGSLEQLRGEKQSQTLEDLFLSLTSSAADTHVSDFLGDN